MATGGEDIEDEEDIYSRSPPSPSLAELTMEAMAFGYGSEEGLYGYFSPRMMLGAYYEEGDEEEDFSDFSNYGDHETRAGRASSPPASGPSWQGGGYDCQFVEGEVPHALQCLICTLAAREARQIDCCGKVFCRACLSKLKRSDNSACPNCRENRWNSFSDKKSDRDIGSLKVKCSNVEQGCKWEGELREMEAHVVGKCSAELVPCQYASLGCKTKVAKKDLPTHESTCMAHHLKMSVERIDVLSRQLKEFQSSISSSSSSSPAAPAVVNVPPVIFKMAGFSRHLNTKKIWESPAFYSHKRGYKMYLRVNVFSSGTSLASLPAPGGGGGGGIGGVSVKACLLHGEHDEDLVWPFRGVVNFELLNQEQDVSHIHGSAKFLERRFSTKNRWVSAEEVKNGLGWGVGNMLLYSDPELDNYMQSDSLQFRVGSVEVAHSNKPWLIA